MTTTIYNGVVMRDCETLAFDQTVQYDESETDLLYSKFRVRIASTLVSLSGRRTGATAINDRESLPFGIDTDEGTTVVQRMHDIQARLSEPRGDFWYLVESCPSDETIPVDESFPAVTQPLLIASGQAFREQIIRDFVGNVGTGEVVERVQREPLSMRANPLSENDASTRLYGRSDVEFPKADVLDCNNGPRPIDVKIDRIIGGRSIRVEFELEICRPVCKEDFEDLEPAILNSGIKNTGREVLSNKWHLEESKDANWVTTRRIDGTLRVANREFYAHAYRLVCVPPLLKGYQRQSQKFISDKTDLVLKYTISDSQKHAAPPYPAIDWSGHHGETASGPNGIRKGGEFKIRLQGAPGVDKKELIAAAGKVAVNRIRGLREPVQIEQGETESDTDFEIRKRENRDYSVILNNAAIVDVLHEPVIEMRLQVTYTDASFRSLALRVKDIGTPLDSLDDPSDYRIPHYDQRVWPVPLPYDSECPAGLFRNLLNSPCSSYHGIPQGFQPEEKELGQIFASEVMESGSPDGSEPRTPSPGVQGTLITVPGVLPEDDGTENPRPQENSSGATSNQDLLRDVFRFPYDFYEIEQRYDVDGNLMQAPLATTDPGVEETTFIAKLGGSISKRHLIVTATRDGRPPVLPKVLDVQEDPNGIKEYLEKSSISMLSPELMADGRGRRIKVKAEYVFAMARPLRPDEIIRGLSSPLDRFAPAMNSIKLSDVTDEGGELVQ